MLDRRLAKISFSFNFFKPFLFVDTSQARPDVKASFSPIRVRQCSCNVFTVVAVVLLAQNKNMKCRTGATNDVTH